MNYAVILAGGTGDRFDKNTPKQFFEIDGKMLVFYSIEAFINSKRVDAIIVVVNKDWLDFFQKKLIEQNYSKKIIVVEGGCNGLESAKNAIFKIKEMEKDLDSFVAIHDAARPFVSTGVINDNFDVAFKYGNAVAAIPLAETLVSLNDDISSTRTIDRNGLMRVQTPQTFKLSELITLFETSNLDSQKHPSTFSLFVANGGRVFVSKGEEINLKITYKNDLCVLLLNKKSN